MITLAVFITSLVISLLAVLSARTVGLRYHVGALPSARRVHSGFIPHLGGMGIFVGMVLGVVLATVLGFLPPDSWREHQFFWFGLIIIVGTGLIDDLRGISPAQKFLGQFLAASLAAGGGCLIEAFFSPFGGNLNLGLFSYPFTILWIMFIINAVNLLDGLDGLAGGISLITLCGFLILAILSGSGFWTVMAVALIGSVLGFLRFNYHPASIFMGDLGSLMLGYILACFSVETLKIANSHQVYFLASLVMLGMPITDTLISFFRRMGRGDHPFKADREHVHHRLLALGLSHLDSVWLMYYFTLLYVALGVLMVVYREITGVLLFAVAMSFSIYWAWRLGYVETRRSISFGIHEQETRASMRPLIHVERVWHQIAMLAADLFSINLAMFLTYWFRFRSGVLESFSIRSLTDYLTAPVFLIFTGIWLLVFWLNGLYRMPWDVSRFDKAVKVSKVITFGILLLLVMLNLDILMNDTPRGPLNAGQLYTLAFYWVAMIVAVSGVRLLVIKLEKIFHIFEYTYKNTLVIGATRKARSIIRDIRNNPHLLYRIVGVVDRKTRSGEFNGIPVLGSYADLPNLIHEHRIEEIIVAIGENAREDLLNIIGICDRLNVVVKTLPELQAIVSGRNPELAGHALIRVFPEKMVLWQWLVKRLVDISFAALLMLATLPFWLTLAVLIKQKFPGSLIVKLPILGRNGRIFKMYLFRLGAPEEVPPAVYGGAGGKHNLSAFGEFLHRTRLYKYPQLFNILRGDMSLVGPRAESPEWYRIHQHHLQFLHRRLMVRPGITGIAQIKYRFDESQRLIRERLKYDIYYVENLSLSLDLRIILRSIFLFFIKTGK